jgi:Xaa-Pro aminopeptidase
MVAHSGGAFADWGVGMSRTEERAVRREWLQAEAVRRGLDGVLVYSSRRGVLNWFTGYSPGFLSNYGVLWVPVKGAAAVGVRFPFEADRAASVSSLEVCGVDEPAALVPAGARRIGLVTGDFAVDETPRALTAALTQRRVEMVDLTPEVDARRRVKSADEIAALVRAAEVGLLALGALGRVIPAGTSDFSIASQVEGAARAAGATRALCLVGIGDGAAVTEVTGAVVRADNPVSVEVTLDVDGACSHVNDTLLPARPRAQHRRGLEVCHAARQVLVSSLRPGASVDDVVRAGDRLLEQHGLLDVKAYDFGHGVGVDTPEHPQLILGTNQQIMVGMVLSVHVAVRHPGGETAFIGGPVAVEQTGARELIDRAPWNSLS